MIISVFTILACSSIIKLFDPSENVILALYLTEIFFIGNAFNYLFIIQSEQIPAELIAVSFEVNYSVA